MTDLIVFDVDGTLTNTTNVDAECLVGALTEVTERPEISADWLLYDHSTDSGIVRQVLFEAGLGADHDAYERVRQRFFDRMEAAYTANPDLFGPMPGATQAFSAVKNSGAAVAIATGAWHESARFKMRVAGVDAYGIPMATADDAVDRVDILMRAIERVRRWTGVAELGRITYVGDAVWDVRAANVLGIGFVGLAPTEQDAQRLTQAGAPVVIASLEELAEVIR
ncbi:MAG: haloacid dehalogenase-like hydrolase [Candidatus Kapabacteria bacterium]|nr:haloacid dehalogenase-like hydrolase [Candidatus Kapabacteria bacterium]